MKYRVIEKGNPANPVSPKKKHANVVNTNKLTLKQFAKKIAIRKNYKK
jgi:hypothetical protein